MNIENKTEIDNIHVRQSHVVCQRSTNGKRVRRDDGSEVEGAISGGETEVEAEDEQEAGMEAEVEGGAGGVSLTITPLQTSIDLMRKREK